MAWQLLPFTRRHRNALACVAVLTAGLAPAAPACALNLREAYDAAFANDATIRAARAAAQATRERLPQAQAQRLPNISASATRNHNDLTSTTQRPLGLPPAREENQYYSGSKILSVRQPLYRPYLGALVRQRGCAIATTVDKTEAGPRQYWRRTLRYPDGAVARFDSHWELAGGNQLVEYVNPWLGLQMAVQVQGSQLCYHGVCYVLRLGRMRLPIPEWLALGHTTIVETATGPRSFAMDFRLTHPLLGQVFRYSGAFESVDGRAPERPVSGSSLPSA